ncbi:helix-turn-helix domain-containing protein [Eggerthella sinensis]|uniref:helix-turn-helix domain-containing protein n=1 Tax=Eggerthella sinensis TaxID=242230 RepID=UPI00248F067E|nr:helix-turn-helix domain-containing protein [Eggerthella sinensis]
MNQAATGRYIHRKRKEKNLTQAQLAERLGVSNKTVSKWENGKCMPDYGIVEDLCDELGVTIAELMDGASAGEGAVAAPDRGEAQRTAFAGMLLVAIGIALLAVSRTLGGSDVRDLLSGALMGISLAVTLAGAYCIGKTLRKR